MAAELKAFGAALRSTATYATSTTSPASRCSSSKNGETATNSDMYKTYLKFPTVNSVGIGPNRKNLRIYYVVFQHVLERKVEGLHWISDGTVIRVEVEVKLKMERREFQVKSWGSVIIITRLKLWLLLVRYEIMLVGMDQDYVNLWENFLVFPTSARVEWSPFTTVSSLYYVSLFLT